MDLQECSLILEHFDTSSNTINNNSNNDNSSNTPLASQIEQQGIQPINSKLEPSTCSSNDDFDYSNLYFEAIDLCLPTTTTTNYNNVQTQPTSHFNSNLCFSQLNNNSAISNRSSSIFSKQRCNSEPISHFFYDEYDEIVYDDSLSNKEFQTPTPVEVTVQNNSEIIQSSDNSTPSPPSTSSSLSSALNSYLQTIELVISNSNKERMEIENNSNSNFNKMPSNVKPIKPKQSTSIITANNNFNIYKNNNNIIQSSHTNNNNKNKKSTLSTIKISPNIKPKILPIISPSSSLSPLSSNAVIPIETASLTNPSQKIIVTIPPPIQPTTNTLKTSSTVGSQNKGMAIQAIQKKIIRKNKPIITNNKIAPSLTASNENPLLQLNSNVVKIEDTKNGIDLCPVGDCVKSFETEQDLKYHKKVQHSIGEKVMDDEEKKYSCHVCNSKFVRPSHLKTHLKLHDNVDNQIKCDYCDERFIKQSMMIHHVTHQHKNNEKLFKCTIEGCKKEYLCKIYLDAHLKNHERDLIQETEKTCFTCDKKFPFVWLKNQHDEIKHKNNEIFKCLYENCGKSFSTSSKLQRHTRIHLKIKEFKCEFKGCDAMFNRREHLVKHNLTHSNGQNNLTNYFFCDFPSCNAKYKTNHNLVVHKKSHEKNEIVKQYSNIKKKQETSILPLLQTEQLLENENLYVKLSSFDVNNNIIINDENLLCRYCDFKCDSHVKLNIHLKSHNIFLSNNNNNNNNNNSSQSTTKSLNDYLATPIISNEKLVDNNDSNDKDIQIDTEDQIMEHEEDEEELININHTDMFINQSFSDNKNTKKGKCEQNGPNQKYELIPLFQAKTDQSEIEENNEDNNENENNYFSPKYEHVININSDDEEYAACTVILENISGSARTDYKSNHVYIEKYRLKSKQKLKERTNSTNSTAGSPSFNKKIKLASTTNETLDEIADLFDSKSTSPLSTISTTSSSNSSGSISTSNFMSKAKMNINNCGISNSKRPRKKLKTSNNILIQKQINNTVSSSIESNDNIPDFVTSGDIYANSLMINNDKNVKNNSNNNADVNMDFINSLNENLLQVQFLQVSFYDSFLNLKQNVKKTLT